MSQNVYRVTKPVEGVAVAEDPVAWKCLQCGYSGWTDFLLLLDSELQLWGSFPGLLVSLPFDILLVSSCRIDTVRVTKLRCPSGEMYDVTAPLHHCRRIVQKVLCCTVLTVTLCSTAQYTQATHWRPVSRRAAAAVTSLLSLCLGLHQLCLSKTWYLSKGKCTGL